RRGARRWDAREWIAVQRRDDPRRRCARPHPRRQQPPLMGASMEDIRSLKAIQLDALREVANIGAGHAATALSTMTGGTIMINARTVQLTRPKDGSAS